MKGVSYKNGMSDLFLDPISLQRMTDPVMNTLCGHTYERTQIEGWMSIKPTCPLCSSRIGLLRDNILIRQALEVLDNPRCNLVGRIEDLTDVEQTEVERAAAALRLQKIINKALDVLKKSNNLAVGIENFTNEDRNAIEAAAITIRTQTVGIENFANKELDAIEAVAVIIMAQRTQDTVNSVPSAPSLERIENSTTGDQGAVDATVVAARVRRALDAGNLILIDGIENLSTEDQISLEEAVEAITTRRILNAGNGIPDRLAEPRFFAKIAEDVRAYSRRWWWPFS